MINVTELDAIAIDGDHITLGYQVKDHPRLDLRLDQPTAVLTAGSLLQALSTLPLENPRTAEVHFAQAGLACLVDTEMRPCLVLTLGPLRLRLNLQESQLAFLVAEIQRHLNALGSARH